MKLDYYTKYVNVLLILIVVYTGFILYTTRDKLYKIYLVRKNNTYFFISVIIFVFLILLYFYLKINFLQMDRDKLSGPEKEEYDIMNKKLQIFRGAIINGLAAIFISMLTLADAIMPAFFVTLVVNYYSNIYL